MILDLVTKAGNLAVSNLLFVHAWSGCDTTSATFGQGKTTLLKKIKASKEIQTVCSAMCNPNASQEEIGQAGLRLFVILYDGKQHDYYYAKFMEMVSSCKTSIDPRKLLPTERAAYFHAFRVHLQLLFGVILEAPILIWITRNGNGSATVRYICQSPQI